MTTALVIDLNIFSTLLLAMLLFIMVPRRDQSHLPGKVFILLVVVTMALLVLEALSWMVNGKEGWYYTQLNYIINFIFLLINPLPSILWINYLDLRINNSMERLKKRGFYLLPLALNLVQMLYSLKSGFVFSIQPGNLYARGPGIYVVMALIFVTLSVGFLLVRESREAVERNLLISLFSFSVLPVVGSIIQVMFYGTVVVWNATALGLVIVFFYLEVQHLNNDYLTGLLNRRQIDSCIQKVIRRKNSDDAFSLVMIDMDDFKAINDTWGHDEGDNALVIFSSILNSVVKARDRVGRFAGDEFLVILDVDDPVYIESIIQRIENAVSEFNARDVKPYRLAFSSGYMVYDQERHSSYRELLRDVDEKMYQEKRRKKRE